MKKSPEGYQNGYARTQRKEKYFQLGLFLKPKSYRGTTWIGFDTSPSVTQDGVDTGDLDAKDKVMM